MKLIVFIALVNILGSASVKGYVPKHHYKHYPYHIEGFEQGPYEVHHPGPRHPHPHHQRPSHEDFRPPPWYNYFNSDESGSESSSEYSDEDNWHKPRYQPCNGWRCSPSTTRKPCKKRTTTPKAIRTSADWRTTEPTYWQTQDSARTIDSNLSKTRTTRDTRSPVQTTTEINRMATTNSSPRTNVEETTISNTVADCMSRCLVTPEYNPVCGTNGQTYENIGRLQCAKDCGVNVDLRRTSPCPPPVNNDIRSSTITPALTTASPRYVNPTELQKCMKQCPISSTYSFVCGTDGVTYLNTARLDCAKRCGKDVQVLCETPCAACYLTTISSTTPETTAQTTSSDDLTRTDPSTRIEQCIQLCPMTSERNPVCGSNGVTYNNPGHLLCSQMCGTDVSLLRFGPCAPVETTTIRREAPSVVTLSPVTLSCIRRCPVTSEYNPVCGTNGQTYENPGRLECAKYCGVNVDLRARTACFLVTQSDPTIATSENSKDIVTNQPTSSKITVTSKESEDNPSTPPSPTQTLSSTTTEPPPSVTISQDILSSVFKFNSSFVSTEPTKVTLADYGEDDIDPRFGKEQDANAVVTKVPKKQDNVDPRFGNDEDTSFWTPSTRKAQDELDPRFGPDEDPITSTPNNYKDRREHKSKFIFPE